MIRRILKLLTPEKPRAQHSPEIHRENSSHVSGNESAVANHGDDFPIPEEWKSILDEMEQNNGHFLVTGHAGAGKTTLIGMFRRLTEKNVVVTAPSGLAAINAEGVTIHSFAQLPTTVITEDSIRDISEKLLLQAIDAIIIDEVNMARCDLLDGLDRFMRRNGRDANLPFGGIQVILVGDPYQLPPIVKDEEKQLLEQAGYPGPYYFWYSKVYPEINPRKIELTTVCGHTEQGFVDVLDCIRANDVDNRKLDILRQCIAESDFDPCCYPYYTILTTRDSEASYYNNNVLYRLPGSQRGYRAKRTGSALNINNPEDNLPCEENLLLRPGARVIFCKDINPRLVKGTMGTVMELEDDAVLMKTDDGRNIRVVSTLWELIKFSYNPETGKIESKVTGTIEQIPLRHSWALTIHKSQGITFNNAHIDLSDGAFARGQTYLALSRCRSFAGIKLKIPFDPEDFMVDQHVVDFMKKGCA